MDCSPFEVIAYFKNADCIVTDTFHGTIFSVITHSNFAVFVRGNGYGNSEKLRDLLGKLDLKDCIIHIPEEINKILDRDIDYSKTDLVIKEEREKTQSYLRRELI